MVANKRIVDVSVIIPTMDRQLSLKRALQSIAAQAFYPSEIIIIDQSKKPFDICKAKKYFAGGNKNPQIQIIHRPDLNNRLTTARNLGIKLASCSKIQFMDDDSCLESKYFEAILPYFETGKYGAVCGRIIEPKTRFHFLARYFQAFFFLGDFRQIREEWYHEKYPKAIETNTLPGVAIFHRKVLEEIKFDPHLPGGYQGDDIELSFRASKRFTFLLVPRPKIRHLPDKQNRANALNQAMEKSRFYKYHFIKNIPKTYRNRFAFIWLNTGFILHALVELSFSRLKGTLKGFFEK